MAYKINGTTVVDNSRNVCACCVTSCCITASDRMDAPSGTTAQRPASPATGSIYFDTDLGSLVSYDGAAWAAVGGGAGLDIEDLVPNKTDAWAFTVTDSCFSYCRDYVSCCAGVVVDLALDTEYVPAYTTTLRMCPALERQVQGTCCPKFFNPETSRCRNSLLCAPLCMCQLMAAQDIRFLSCYNSFCTACICPRLAFPITPNIWGQAKQPAYIGDTTIQPYHCIGTASDTYFGRYAELFFNAKGGSTLQFSTCLSPYLVCNSNVCSYVAFGRLNTPRYFSNSYFGEVAFIRTPIGCNDKLGSSCNLRCCAYYVVTEDTYGTGLEETCDFASIAKSGPNICSEYFPYSCQCSCLCYGLDFLCNSDIGCSATEQLPPIMPCYYCLPRSICGGDITFYNSRVTPFLGGGVHCKESFDGHVCSYEDGVCLASFNGGCCSFGVVYWFGHQQCCLCIRGITSIPGLTFPSKDGCCIHRVYTCCLTGTYPAICSCKIDSAVSTSCFCTFLRLYQSNINRINPGVVSHKGFCCIQFDDWECNIFGCTGGVDPKRCSHSAEMSYLASLLDIAEDPNTMKNYNPLQFSAGMPYRCRIAQMNLDVAHHAIWSKVCDRKAIFFAPVTYCSPKIGIFDCCKDSFDLVYDLSTFDCNIFARNLVGAYGVKPNCMIGEGNSTCWLTGGITSTCWCTWRDCMCVLTGNPSLSLMHKCLGYSMDNNDPLSDIGITPIGGDISYSMVHNRTNDHVVLFRAIGFGPQGCCLCKITWMGAICWDIHNRCISKVNTIYPPSPDGALQYQKNSYWCSIECAKICPTYTNSCHALVVCTNLYFRSSFSPCYSSKQEGIRALPYGNVNSYRESGCTDLGGFYVAGGLGCLGNYNVLASKCSQTPGVCDAYYYSCTALACGIPANFCNCVMDVRPMFKYLAKVPFDKPLECVGFRSEPELAKMMNSIAAPACCSCYFTNLSALCSPGHKCLTMCACGCSFRVGPLAVCQSIDCFVWGPYGFCDCIKWQKTISVICPGTVMNFCHCVVTGGVTCAFTPTPFCCYTEYRGSCGAQSCAQVYKCLQPCHFDENETSKLKLYPYLETKAKLNTHNYSDKPNRIECRFVPLNEGEDPYERFHRQWNEDVIKCC